jgi:hypothetical protein
MTQNEWKDSTKELPPSDGIYLAIHNPLNPREYPEVCFYDGYGFKYGNSYVRPSFWKNVPKRYGPIND